MPRAVLILTLVAGLLRFSTLDAQSYWLDEAATVELVRMGLGEMLQEIPEGESTPPLYYLLAWLWAKVFGSGEAGLRSLSALIGTASIPVFFAAAAELCSRRVGLAVAALASFSPLLVWYSQEARTYALLVLLCGLSLLFFARLLEQPSARSAAGWGLFSALALASHYFAAFLVLPEAVWLLLQPAVRRHALPAVGGVALTALALLPLALHQRSLGLASFIAADSLPLRLGRSAKSFLVGFDAPLELVLALAATVIALAGAGLALTRADPGDRSGAELATALGVFAVVAPLVLALAGVDYLDTRNLLAAWLPLATLAAAGLVSRTAGLAGIAGLGLLCAFGLAAVAGVVIEPAWQRDDWRGIAATLGEARGPRALAVQPASGVRPLRIYLDRSEAVPAEGPEAIEIASLHPARHRAAGIHPDPPPPPRVVPIDGFKRVRVETTSSYTVVVYRATRPRRVTPPELEALEPVPGQPAAALLQR